MWVLRLAAVISSMASAGRVDFNNNNHRQHSITLITHCSVDRLWNVRAICDRWRGPLSLAMFAPGRPEIIDEAKQGLGRCNHVVTLITERLERYPTNQLRNMALREARTFETTHVFVVDADFWPSPRARSHIAESLEYVSNNLGADMRRVALVVPSFAIELRSTDQVLKWIYAQGEDFMQRLANAAMPQSVLELKRCIVRCKERHGRTSVITRKKPADMAAAQARAKALWRAPMSNTDGGMLFAIYDKLVEATAQMLNCAPFHHHSTTRFGEWLVQTKPYQLKCFVGNFFEPFIVVPTPNMEVGSTPFFDERFDGYGKNKIEWVTRLRAANFSFWSTPKAFLVHSLHKKSDDKKKWDQEHGRGIKGRAEELNSIYFQSLESNGLYEDAPEFATFSAVPGYNEDSLATKHCFDPDLKNSIEADDKACYDVADIAAACVDVPPGTTLRGNCASTFRTTQEKWARIYKASEELARNKSYLKDFHPQ